jgi:hypothetical protein
MKKSTLANQGISRAFKRQRFNFIANKPQAWQEQATQLKRIADITYSICKTATEEYMRISRQHFDNGDFQEGVHPLPKEEAALLRLSTLKPIYLMLIGLAIENLAKGVLISRSAAEYVGQEGHLRKPIKTHKLVDLAQLCNLPLSSDQENMLKKLTSYIEWAGRYPVPETLSGMYQFGFGTGHLGGHYNSTDYDLAEVLFRQFWDLLENECKANSS